jgi:transposase
VDAASIEVNRRARRAKTDRLDGFKLQAMLLRHHGGERVWSVLREPTPEQEDARRRDRELLRLSSVSDGVHPCLHAGEDAVLDAHRVRDQH